VRPRFFRRRVDRRVAVAAPSVPGAFHVPLALARRVAHWPPGIPVTIAEPFGASVMVEVVDVDGATLDILVVHPDLLSVLT
jgi:hypothetical protein